MTLHEAIEKLLSERGSSMTTSEIAAELNQNKWYQKKDGSPISAFQIHGRTRNYSHLFDRDGSTVMLRNVSSDNLPGQKFRENHIASTRQKGRNDSDENYVIDLCDHVLGLKSSRQHKFDFLLGDPNPKGVCAKLPVDAYYPKLDLVIEYRERQHTEEIKHFDKPTKMTVSGVHRGEQRRIYDLRRRQVLPENGIDLFEISYSDFKHDSQKRIIRNPEDDKKTVKNILRQRRI